MLHIVLYEPEIPGNTGNAIRLAANTGAPIAQTDDPIQAAITITANMMRSGGRV